MYSVIFILLLDRNSVDMFSHISSFFTSLYDDMILSIASAPDIKSCLEVEKN